MSVTEIGIVSVLLGVCWLLSKMSLMTPFLAASVAYSIGLAFKYPASLILSLVVCFYFSVLLANEEVDNNAILMNVGFYKVAARSPFLKTFKLSLFVGFFLLPIPKAPGYFTGFIAFALIFFCSALYSTPKPNDNFIQYFISFSIASFVIWATSCLFPAINIVVPLLAGIVLFRSLSPSHSSPPPVTLDTSNEFPGIGPLLWSFLFTWITPGLSCSSVTSLCVYPGPWRSIFASCVSLCLEAWNLSLLFRGELSSKSPLADVLTLPNRVNHTPLLDVYGSSFSDIILVFIPLAISFGIYWLDSIQLDVPSWFLSVPFCCQAFITTGSSALFIIAVGYLISYGFFKLSLSNQFQASIIVMPMMF